MVKLTDKSITIVIAYMFKDLKKNLNIKGEK